MVPQIINWASSVRERLLPNPGKTLEIGSYIINGTVRDAFRDVPDYIAIDMNEGPGVDLVLPSTAAIHRWGTEAFDTILCFETLEHDRTFWRTVEDMHLMLKRGGHLLISTPGIEFNVYHGYPKDYYRFTFDTYRDVFFANMDIIELTDFTTDYGPGKAPPVYPPNAVIGGIAKKR